MEQTRARGWRFYVGLALFVYSCGTFGIAALVPFLVSPTVAATLVTCVIVSGEIGFWVSAALLGRPFIDALKAKVAALFPAADVAVGHPPRPDYLVSVGAKGTDQAAAQANDRDGRVPDQP